MSDAERYGYILPESEEKIDAIAQQEKPSAFTQEELNQRAQCAQTSDIISGLDTRALESGGPWVTEFDGAAKAVREGQPWKRAIQEWTDCLAKSGIPSDPGRFSAAGVDWETVDKYRVREHDVELAVIDVQCKTSTNLVKRLADLDAGAQQPVVEKYRSELEKSRDELEAVLARAQEVLRNAGL